MKSSTCSGHAVHLSERSDAGKIIIPQVVGMGKGESVLRGDSTLRAVDDKTGGALVTDIEVVAAGGLGERAHQEGLDSSM
jgi:hypothetical protein